METFVYRNWPVPSMDAIFRAVALAAAAGVLAATMLALVVGPTPLAVVGALGAALPVGMIYALFTAEAAATE